MKGKYTTKIIKKADWWIGWVEDIPGTNSQAKTKAELMKLLISATAEAIGLDNGKKLEASEAWRRGKGCSK